MTLINITLLVWFYNSPLCRAVFQYKGHHFRYKDFYCKDEFVKRPSHLYDENPYTGMVSFILRQPPGVIHAVAVIAPCFCSNPFFALNYLALIILMSFFSSMIMTSLMNYQNEIGCNTIWFVGKMDYVTVFSVIHNQLNCSDNAGNVIYSTPKRKLNFKFIVL